MALAPGTRLGPDEILASLGAGGMGEVFKARNTRLDQLSIGIEFDALPGQDRELLALGLSLEKVLGPVPAPRI